MVADAGRIPSSLTALPLGAGEDSGLVFFPVFCLLGSLMFCVSIWLKLAPRGRGIASCNSVPASLTGPWLPEYVLKPERKALGVFKCKLEGLLAVVEPSSWVN